MRDPISKIARVVFSDFHGMKNYKNVHRQDLIYVFRFNFDFEHSKTVENL